MAVFLDSYLNISYVTYLIPTMAFWSGTFLYYFYKHYKKSFFYYYSLLFLLIPAGLIISLFTSPMILVYYLTIVQYITSDPANTKYEDKNITILPSIGVMTRPHYELYKKNGWLIKKLNETIPVETETDEPDELKVSYQGDNYIHIEISNKDTVYFRIYKLNHSE